MKTWVLIMWGMYVPAFLGGEYRTYDQCEAAGAVQTVALRGEYGPGALHWVCKQQSRFEQLRQ